MRLDGGIADDATAGSLTKTGDGTLVLTGDASYGGTTTIAAGTLQLGANGQGGALPTRIVDEGTLVLDRVGDIEYAGTIAGGGTFRKDGAGVLRMTGDSGAFAGTSSVEAGTLRLDGALGGHLRMATGTLLTGSGAAGSVALDAGAELSPGAAGTIGTFTVRGDLALAAGSRLTVDASAGGTSDRVSVAGRALLGGGSVVSLGSGAGWRASTTYTILSAAGGVDGTFADVSSDLAFLTPTLAYGANAVNLTLARNDVAFADIAGTRNQRATAGAIEASGRGTPLYDAVVRLDAPDARRAFDALSGEIHANVRGAIADDDRYQRDAIRQHLLASPSQDDRDPGAWAAAWGHWGHHAGDGNAARLRANGSGLLVGADTAIGDGQRLGVALGSGNLSADARGDDASARTRTAALYASGRYGDVLLQGGALVSRRDIDTHRKAGVDGSGSQLDGRQHATSTQAYVDVAYDIQVARGSVAPWLEVARQRLRTDGVHERGGGAALDVEDERSAQTFATLGVRGQWAFASRGDVALFASAGWQHAWGDTATATRQHFAGQDATFRVAGTPIADDAGVATVGLRFRPAASVTIDASCAGQFASDARDASARVVVNWAF